MSALWSHFILSIIRNETSFTFISIWKYPVDILNRQKREWERKILYFSQFRDANIIWRRRERLSMVLKCLLKLDKFAMRSYEKVSLCFKSVSWNLNKASELLTIPLPRSWELFRHLNIKENILGKLIWKGIQRSY